MKTELDGLLLFFWGGGGGGGATIFFFLFFFFFSSDSFSQVFYFRGIISEVLNSRMSICVVFMAYKL